MITLRHFLILFVLCLFMASCATNQHKEPQSHIKILDLQHQSFFEFRGKMSFSDGNEGGSGQVSWKKSEQQVTVKLKAPLSNKSWTLSSGSHNASIETSAGEQYHSTSAAELLSHQVGWSVPWKSLQSWVVGWPTEKGRVEWDDDHEGYTVVDQGWVINYSKLKNYGSFVLPHKVIARKQPYSIKLSIKSWEW